MRTTAWVGLGLLSVGALAVGAAAEPVPAPPPPAATPAADPAALIADLGSPDYRAREKAGAALEALGERALPQLQKALDDSRNPEVTRRLTALVRRVERDRLVNPKRVTLAVKDATVKDVLDEITRQTGYRLQVNGSTPDMRVSFNLDRVPFWEALDKVAAAAGLTARAELYGGDEDAVYLNPGASGPAYVGYAGPFRCVAMSINSNRSVSLNPGAGVPNARGQESLTFQFVIQGEPKVTILGAGQPDVQVATDDAGGSLLPPQSPNYGRSYYSSPYYGRQRTASVNLGLYRTDRVGTTIKTLKGRVVLSLLSAVTPDVVVPDPLNAKEKTFTGRTVQVDFKSLTNVNGTYQAAMTIAKRSTTGQPDYAWSNSLQQKIDLLDEKGERYQPMGWSNFQQNNNGTAVTVTLMFSPQTRNGEAKKLGPPVKMVVNEWQASGHEVDFEFKNLPLP